MVGWWRRQGDAYLAVFLLLILTGLILLAGLVPWETVPLILLSLLALVCAAVFALVVFRLAQASLRFQRRDARSLEQEIQQTREQVFELTQDLRRKADQLTTERDRAEFLHQSFTELTSTLDPRRVLDGILQRAILMAGARWGSLLLFDEQGRPVEMFLSRSAGSRMLGPRTAQVLDRGLAGWVVRNRRGDVIYDTTEDGRWLTFAGDKDQARSAVAVPFQRRDRVLGVMVLTHPIPFQFSDTHLSLLQELARQAAVCLENADLYTLAEGERRKLAAILDGTTDAVVVVDVEGRVSLLNPAACRAFAVFLDATLGRPLVAGMEHQGLTDLFSQALQQMESVTGELITADERVRFCNVSPVPGVGWVAVLQDITYLKELDRLKSEFVSTVSHDLRSPLTSVRGYTDLIPALGPVTEEQHDALGRIRRAATQMSELVGDLLDLGKIEAGIEMHMSPCRLGEVVAGAVESLALTAELKGLEMRVEIEPDVPAVMGNAGRLRQVVANLLSNAIKYTPARGRVQVLLGRRGEEVVLAVTDTGLGIAPQDQAQLFQKFYRVRTPETEGIPGTGLGLAICRSIIDSHGGRIWVRSAPGRGSTFSFGLPVLGEEAVGGLTTGTGREANDDFIPSHSPQGPD